MSRWTKEDYMKVFGAVKENLDGLVVEGFVADFEKAALQAICYSFLGVSIMGCVFHWRQAVWRHVQQLGLSETYRQRLGIHSFVRQMLALPILPHMHIPWAMEALAAQASTLQTQSLVNYVRDQWIDSSVFPPECWSIFKQTVRTNNDVEGWHHRLNSKAVHTGLQFCKLVPLLRREADLVPLAVSASDLNRNTLQGSTGPPGCYMGVIFGEGHYDIFATSVLC